MFLWSLDYDSLGREIENHVLHQGEYAGWIRTKTQFADHILNVITKATATKLLKNGRTGYWHEQTKSVVIYNSFAADGGTAFHVSEGIN